MSVVVREVAGAAPTVAGRSCSPRAPTRSCSTSSPTRAARRRCRRACATTRRRWPRCARSSASTRSRACAPWSSGTRSSTTRRSTSTTRRRGCGGGARRRRSPTARRAAAEQEVLAAELEDGSPSSARARSRQAAGARCVDDLAARERARRALGPHGRQEGDGDRDRRSCALITPAMDVHDLGAADEPVLVARLASARDAARARRRGPPTGARDRRRDARARRRRR